MTVVHALVISKIDDYNVLYIGLPLKILQKIQQVKSAVARLIFVASTFDYISLVLPCLH